MNIQVVLEDINGNTNHQNISINKLGMVKHMAFAGLAYAAMPSKILRALGMMLHYSSYLQTKALQNDHFSLPPQLISDPTEQGQFSNIVGRAIADFMSKKIDKSFFTVTYEAIAQRPMVGNRPDLIAFSRNGVFCLEAKGLKNSQSGNMGYHKTQAYSGNYPRNFSVACVSYAIYSKIQCKYHRKPPVNFNANYILNSGINNTTTFTSCSKKYYKGLLEFLNTDIFNITEGIIYGGEEFYEIELSFRSLRDRFSEEFLFFPYWYQEFFDMYSPRLILPKQIIKYAQDGLSLDTIPFEQIQDGNNLYIDSDRIGLRIVPKYTLEEIRKNTEYLWDIMKYKM